MYPLEVNLVGCSDNVLPHVRRELLNLSAHREMEFPDVEQALQVLRRADGDPRLLIVHLKGPADVESLRRLSGTLVGQPILALVEGSDGRLYLQAMRAGAAQIVPLPLVPEDFRSAMDAIAVQFGSARGGGRVVAVAGSNGGSGATTIAVNLAYELAFLHKTRTALVELSHQMGSLATLLNVQPRYTTNDLFSNVERLDVYMVKAALTPFAENLEILPGPYQAISTQTVSAADIRRLVECTRGLAEVLVLDVPSSYDSCFFEALQCANQVVLVGEQKIPSIRALQMIHEALGARTHHVLINRYDPKVKGFHADALQEILGVPQLLTVADDAASVLGAVNHGRPLRLEAANSPALADIDALARLVLGIATPAPPRARNTVIFQWVSRAFGG